MNWEAIKFIYRCVLIYSYNIKYFGDDKYSLVFNGVEFSHKYDYKNNTYIGVRTYDKYGKRILT